MNPDISKLHDEAMNIAMDAEVAKWRGEHAVAKGMSLKAMEYERQAAFLVPSDAALTRMVLFRSAAALAFASGEFRESLRLIKIGLNTNGPEAIRRELLSLRKSVWKRLQRTPGMGLGTPVPAIVVTANVCLVYEIARADLFNTRRNRVRRFTSERRMGLKRTAILPKGTEVAVLEACPRQQMVRIRTATVDGWVRRRSLKKSFTKVARSQATTESLFFGVNASCSGQSDSQFLFMKSFQAVNEPVDRK